jgi:replicative DNA helicase
LDEDAPVSALSVASRLKQSSEIQKAGGFAYLSELENLVNKRLDRAEIEYFAGKIKEKSLLRQLAYLGEDIRIKAFDEEETANVLLEQFYDSLLCT